MARPDFENALVKLSKALKKIQKSGVMLLSIDLVVRNDNDKNCDKWAGTIYIRYKTFETIIDKYSIKIEKYTDNFFPVKAIAEIYGFNVVALVPQRKIQDEPWAALIAGAEGEHAS